MQLIEIKDSFILSAYDDTPKFDVKTEAGNVTERKNTKKNFSHSEN